MKRHLLRSSLYSLAAVALVYFIAAYLVLPWVWSHYEHQPGLAAHPAITVTPQGIPGDPLNVGLVGEKASVIRALLRAGWTPADPITLKSSLEIAESVVLDRPYRDAPVSTLLYEGRKQDLAFEKPIGTSADRRNHVRFWLVLDKGAEGRPVWLGSATLDHGVGVSHYTGQITHHIAADVDAERDFLIGDLIKAKAVIELYQVSGVGPTVNGRNGGGDWYHTDGEIKVAVLSPDAAEVSVPPKLLEEPPLVQLKDGMWSSVSSWIGTDADSTEL
jgi:LssY C-terminus